jgi:tRNA threonylcarbamoyladenosine biosynthesis protein TsaE
VCEPPLVFDARSEDETTQLGRALARVATAGTVIGLIGPLGAGKTRLARAIAEELGVPGDHVTSPTFILIHEYQGTLQIFHFDTYRLRSADEFEALGPADYWNAGGLCLIEWADRVAALLPQDAWSITLEPTGETARRFRCTVPSAVAVRLRAQLV